MTELKLTIPEVSVEEVYKSNPKIYIAGLDNQKIRN